MNIIRQNTTPSFEIVPRSVLDIETDYLMSLKSEFSTDIQLILCDVIPLSNENYLLTMQDFPTGKIGEKFSYTLSNPLTDEIVSLGRLLIVGETESVQDYSKQANTKFYT